MNLNATMIKHAESWLATRSALASLDSPSPRRLDLRALIPHPRPHPSRCALARLGLSFRSHSQLIASERMTRTITLGQWLPAALFLALSTAPLSAQLVRPYRPTPPAGPYQVLKSDLHMHTVFSDGVVWPDVRPQEAWRDGLDVIAITDHDDYRPHEKDVSMDLERPYQIARPVAEGLGLLIVPGVEITRGNIHFNALFVKDKNAFRGKELQAALTEAKKQGAYSFWNHPGWKGTADWWPPIAAAYADKLFQGIELLNGSSYYSEAHPWVEQRGLAILGNSDIHAAAQPGQPRTLTLILSRTRTLDGVREALEARRTIAWNGKALYGNAEWLGSLFRAYVRTPERASVVAGTSSFAFPLENVSAVPFELKLLEAPVWLALPLGDTPALATTVLRGSLRKDAPAGPLHVKLRVEVTNAHTGPGQRLELPLEFDLER